MPKEREDRARELGSAILEVLNAEGNRSAPDDLIILLALTATLRAKPANAGPIVAKFLHYSNPRKRADAANTLARLKLKDGNNQLQKLLVSDPDPIVRANAARVLSATEAASLDQLLERAQKDKDARVRVSAIRALALLGGGSALAGLLKDRPASVALIERGATLLLAATAKSKDKRSPRPRPVQANELLEIANTLGRSKTSFKRPSNHDLAETDSTGHRTCSRG